MRYRRGVGGIGAKEIRLLVLGVYTCLVDRNGDITISFQFEI